MPIRQCFASCPSGVYALLPSSINMKLINVATFVKVPLQNISVWGFYAFTSYQFNSHDNLSNISSFLHFKTEIRRFGRLGLKTSTLGSLINSDVLITFCVLSSAVPVNASIGVPGNAMRNKKIMLVICTLSFIMRFDDIEQS